MKKLLPILGLLTCLSVQVFAQVPPVPQSSIIQLYNPPLTKAAVATGTGWMQFPRAFGFDIKTANNDATRKILLSWGVSEDDLTVPSVFNRRISPDGGLGYWATVTSPNVNFGNALKKRDGTILCMPYNVIRDSAGINEKQFGLNYFTSIDDGLNFTSHTGTLNFPFNVNWVKITRGVFESEGVLYMPFYAAYQGYPGSRCVIAKSVDQGQTWGWHADITNPTKDGSASYDEVTVAVCSNGDWLSVFRSGEYKPIKYCRSTNKGVDWSTADVLPDLGGASTDADDFNESVDPLLQLLPNGIMVLSYGRPNSHIAFSYDSGYNWNFLATTFKETAGRLPEVNGKQSTNYLAMVPLGYNKFMQYGDTGGDFTYRNANGVINNHPNPNPYSIWQKPFEIVTNRQNRIDLKRKILNDSTIVMSATTLTYTTSAHPETRKLGAVDGSMDYWSAAIGTTSGIYQLDLQKTYRLNAIGIGLLYEKEQSATVQYATTANPTTWITLVSYSNVVHRNINYTDITPVNARYIKVTVSGTGQIGLGELELYETSSTFEGNAATPTSVVHGVIPYGYALYNNTASKHGISVRDIYGYQSNRALTFYDGNENYIAGLKRIETASNKKTLEFRFRAVTIPNNQFISMHILGMASGSEKTIFYLAVMPDGSIKANEGSGLTADIAPANTIERSTTSAWNLIKVEADESANLAKVYINGTLKGSCTMFQNPSDATTLTGFAFSSAGLATFGELAYFDDINFYNPDTEQPSGVLSSGSVQQQQLNHLPAEPTSKFSIKVSPNPAKDIVNIQVSHTVEGKIKLTVLNAVGIPVKTINALSGRDGFFYDLPTGNFLPGLYVISAQQDNKIVRAKVIIVP